MADVKCYKAKNILGLIRKMFKTDMQVKNKFSVCNFFKLKKEFLECRRVQVEQ